MKLKKRFLLLSFLFIGIAFGSGLRAQDTIQRNNGEMIFGKVLEVGSASISYKKTGFEDGPTYSEELKNVANIRYKSGRREQYKKSKLVSTTTYTVPSTTAKTTATTNPQDSKMPNLYGSEKLPSESTPSTNNNGTNNSTANTPPVDDNNPLKNGPVSNQYRIDHLDKKFLVNNQKVSQKSVDKLLAKSTNPAVVAMAKTAKITKTFQKITKLTSIPTTIGGGIASIATFSQVYKQVQKGGASTQSYVNAGLSFLGTLTLPITSKILKSRRDKLYDKAIDLYNLKN